MPFDSSLTLNAGLGAQLTRAVLPGVNGSGGAGTAKELVTAGSPTRTLNNSAALGSDAAGNYVTVGHNTTDSCYVAETLDPTNAAGTLILTFKPLDTAGAGSWLPLAGLGNNDGSQPIMFGLHLVGSGPAMGLARAASGFSQFDAAESNFANNTLITVVITYDAGGSAVKFYSTSQSVITGSFDSGTQITGASTKWFVGAMPGWGNAYGVQMYFIGYIDNVALGATDAQAIADDAEAQLFTAAGGAKPWFLLDGSMTGGFL